MKLSEFEHLNSVAHSVYGKREYDWQKAEHDGSRLVNNLAEHLGLYGGEGSYMGGETMLLFASHKTNETYFGAMRALVENVVVLDTVGGENSMTGLMHRTMGGWAAYRSLQHPLTMDIRAAGSKGAVRISDRGSSSGVSLLEIPGIQLEDAMGMVSLMDNAFYDIPEYRWRLNEAWLERWLPQLLEVD